MMRTSIKILSIAFAAFILSVPLFVDAYNNKVNDDETVVIFMNAGEKKFLDNPIINGADGAISVVNDQITAEELVEENDEEQENEGLIYSADVTSSDSSASSSNDEGTNNENEDGSSSTGSLGDSGNELIIKNENDASSGDGNENGGKGKGNDEQTFETLDMHKPDDKSAAANLVNL